MILLSMVPIFTSNIIHLYIPILPFTVVFNNLQIDLLNMRDRNGSIITDLQQKIVIWLSEGGYKQMDTSIPCWQLALLGWQQMTNQYGSSNPSFPPNCICSRAPSKPLINTDPMIFIKHSNFEHPAQNSK